MPLPENQQIAVKPNTAEVRNKHAITLRMSEDLIEALMANPGNLSFEFNTPNQGIYVNDQCFGLSLAKEQSPHELFMQMPQHRDRSLKHYADISHRFTVSAASLDEAAKKLRVATEEANKQRQERKVVMLDDPPLSTSTTAAKKKPAARKQVASSSSAPSRQSGTQPAQPPPPPSRPLSAIDPGLRHRVVQCLASAARTADELVKLVCGSASDERKRGDVRTIMQDVAEARDGLWRLSNKGWLEVQPYKCRTEADRQQALRKATAAFKALKIPESDPRWENLSPPKPAPKPMPPPPPAPAASTSATRHPLPAKPPAPEVKRSTATKEKKPRAKPETKEIMMKDERRPPSVPSPAGLSKPKELPKSSATPLPAEPPRPARVEALSTATARRPGSGYKAPKSLTPPLRGSTSTSSDKRDELPAASPSMRASTSKAPAAARPSSADPSRSSSAHHTPTPQPRDRERTASSSSQPARPRTDSKERASAASSSSRPREAESKKPADDVRRHAMKREEEETPPKKLTTKRKVPARYDYSDSDSEDERLRAKRRKVAEGSARPSTSTKKSDSPVKIKRSDSPVPIPPPPARSRNPERDALANLGRIQKKERPVPPARLASEQSTSSTSSHKRRRASTPHFTSSEEEGEDPSEREMQRPAKKKKALAKEKERERERDRERDRDRDRDSARPSTKPRKSRPPTADGLQEEYQAKFMEYYPVAMADRKQRAIIQRLLDAASDESVDEDGLLSEGEGKALHANHLRLRSELLELEKQYTKLAPAAA
ncbi:uncharacterized protein SCHCODRAFT_02703315 [Schizophyllum commune H4-8]|uniref:Uncharacterized protein n=1 Tax=Schizophyllum commune (strain H4-8 / FGSC 9210) TaxID=578458 RepID=D8Q8I6_SCHCM|nr:uncharacterized protein SCHCODRAFT_02703315 [Schizophyllum commune H4-8]KAI5890798.1 hypothetical protein SCHCODRAFT_02703315 [Schizophyllum commune H4-8]